MSIDPEVEAEAQKILKPIDDLIAKELEDLKQADEKIQKAERKCDKVFPPVHLESEH
ncbi:MAG TPA: hypothetical protein VFE62_12710 [Gemmataceae bacterium]|nr:hypothetical protein [Gemmataceae bacterium]